jgi:hypothetical protein
MQNYLLGRLNEPSSWRGLALIASSFASQYVTPEQALQIVEYGLGIAGVLGLTTKDR